MSLSISDVLSKYINILDKKKVKTTNKNAKKRLTTAKKHLNSLKTASRKEIQSDLEKRLTNLQIATNELSYGTLDASTKVLKKQLTFEMNHLKKLLNEL